MTDPVLQVFGVTKRFGGTAALRGPDFEVAPGEYFCIVGPSGSGKSTLLRVLAGFETPDSGEVRLRGERVDSVPPDRRDLNTVFQGYALFPHLSVFENVAFGLRVRRTPRDELVHRVRDALELVGLADFGARGPRSLSGGEQQRVALARALVNRPSVLLLDEPLSALDRKLRVRMQDELARVQRETGIGFVHVTHDQEEALRLADRLAVMNRGRFLQVGDPEEVYAHPRTAFVADFLGSANVFGARVVGADPPTIEIPGGPVLPLMGAHAPLRVGQEGEFAVRPEALRLDRQGGHPSDAGPQAISGILLTRARVGSLDDLRVRVGKLVWRVRSRAPRSEGGPAVGDTVTLLLDPADLIPLVPDDLAEGAP